jgi:carboxyl-terminal processing protease
MTNMLTYFLPKYIPVFTGKSIVIDADDAVAAANIKKMLYLSDQLEQNFLWDIDEQAMWDSAVKGMFAGLDDVYSGYMTAEEYAAYTESTSGSYSGIGVNITNNDDNNVQILRVFSGSPAESAGLKAGDIILSAGDTSLVGLSVDVAATYIKGEECTSVTLTVSRTETNFPWMSRAAASRSSIRRIKCFPATSAIYASPNSKRTRINNSRWPSAPLTIWACRA